ncbi:MAG: Rpn family recombination-promoting nuclease/putative transposase [Bacteroides sp.]|nr:Rpn family recombination-promoting nuclease/putative transposase [Eubacterium sp.]MCM1417869.1 Rpn family recombination-promoting nuclease/putative transposase [Roseburia sp.]MCM1461308.1 Rpn family recombination-promoting nuclease/putative transposase [Bacteroides sp.]
MARNVVKAKLDIIFKKLFTSDNAVLSAFLEDILDMAKGSVKKIDVINPNILPSAIDGKQGSLDLKMYVDNKVVNVEIQLKDEGNFRDRSVYYWSKMYADELKRGQGYEDLKQTIAINILNFSLFDCDAPYSSFKLLETTRRELLTDKCSILFFELTKVNQKVDPGDRKKLWLQLINAETEEELDMLDQTGVPEIQKAVMILHEMSLDEEVREMARLREKWILDENSALRNAERRGIDKGKREGKREGLEAAAQKMRKSGMTEDQIRKILNA